MSNPCLGLTWLGSCAYNPALPSPTYFTLGNAVAALAFTLAVHTFLRPIYRLRLGVRYLSLSRLYVLIFSAVGVTAIAALVPSFPILHGGWWGYPITYEILATLMFAVAYGAVAIAVTRPVQVAENRVEHFARWVARLLSEATEADHLDLLQDLRLSVPRLIKLAAFVEDRREVSAFYIFIHRHKILHGSYAHSILRILSDPHLCRSLVVRAPWVVADLIRELGEQKLYAASAERFVQELAHQAILADNGIMAREIGFHGFAEAPVLSEALFSDRFIVRTYNPLDTYLRSDAITASILERFNEAAKRCYNCLIEDKAFDHSHVAFSIERFYENAGLRAWSLHASGGSDVDFSIQFGRAVRQAIGLANKLMAAADEVTYQWMFVSKPDEHRSDALEPLVEIVFNALCHISKGFQGVSDSYWHVAMDTMHNGFRSIGAEPDGLTPFQQRLALKLADKMKDNMNGYYPAVTRVLLATVGPYERNALQANMTAFNILRNVMYANSRSCPR